MLGFMEISLQKLLLLEQFPLLLTGSWFYLHLRVSVLWYFSKFFLPFCDTLSIFLWYLSKYYSSLN